MPLYGQAQLLRSTAQPAVLALTPQQWQQQQQLQQHLLQQSRHQVCIAGVTISTVSIPSLLFCRG